MARRVTFADSVKKPEKKEYFNSKFSLKNVTGMKKPGDEAFVLLLRPEEYLFQIDYHTVREKIHGQVGFKGIYDAKILCKRVNEEGVRSEELPLCCQYADKLFKEAKEKAKEEAVMLGKDPEVKENVKFTAPLTFAATQMYIPLIVLGNTEVDSNAKPTIHKLAIKNGRRMFAYLEMNKKSYISEIYDKLKEELVNNGEIDPDTDEETLANIMLSYFKTRIIKITAVESKSPRVPYERSYSFIPFTNKLIGSKSGEYEAIKSYEKDEELQNEAVEFLSLFEVEVDNFVKDWTDDELTKYLIEDTKRKEDIDTFKEADAKIQQQEEAIIPKKASTPAIDDIMNAPESVTPKASTPAVADIMNAPVVQTSEISISEEDITFDAEDDDFVDDDEE